MMHLITAFIAIDINQRRHYSDEKEKDMSSHACSSHHVLLLHLQLQSEKLHSELTLLNC